jgi:hypothetical protein
MQDIPRVKKAVLTQKLNIAIEDDLHSRLGKLRSDYGIDVAECLRRVIRKEADRLETSVADGKVS